MARQSVVGPAAGFTLSGWQIALALLAVLALSQATLWGMLDFATSDPATSAGPMQVPYSVAVAGIVLGVIEFLFLGFVLAGMVRWLGGEWLPGAVLTAFLLLPVATLVGRSLLLSTSMLLDWVDRPLVAQNYPQIAALLNGVNWLLLRPSFFTLVLILITVLAARIGGKLPWLAATMAGLGVAACSFAVGYAVFLGLAPGNAASLAFLDMLRLG